MPNYLCEVSGSQVTFCEETLDELTSSFEWFLDKSTKRPTSILISAETEMEAKEKAQAQLDKDYGIESDNA